VEKETALIKVQKEIETIASLGYREMASHVPKDRKAIGFFCLYVPEELLHAAGFYPLRLMGTAIKMSHVQAHLPSNCCHLVKSSLESLLQGELDFLQGVVFTQTCDSMQELSDIWAYQRRLPIHFNLMVPTNLSSEHSRPYLKLEMERFKEFLESHSGKITPERLKASIQLFNRIREKLGEIYSRRRRGLTSWSSGFFAQIIRAGYLVDRARYLELLGELLNALPEQAEEGKDLVPVYLSGNMAHSESYFFLIEEAGAMVVQDNLCTGARTLRLMVQENVDPIEALTQRYFTSFFVRPRSRSGPSKALREVGIRPRSHLSPVQILRSPLFRLSGPESGTRIKRHPLLAFGCGGSVPVPGTVKDSPSGLCGNASTLLKGLNFYALQAFVWVLSLFL
jgi:benzoyl-CoA reductase/2-hydroxyglutaryl-CoA dehydratase subunit BcrC/BadD/HgdB